MRERQQMASRPFASVAVVLEVGGDQEELLQRELVFHSVFCGSDAQATKLDPQLHPPALKGPPAAPPQPPRSPPERLRGAQRQMFQEFVNERIHLLSQSELKVGLGSARLGSPASRSLRGLPPADLRLSLVSISFLKERQRIEKLRESSSACSTTPCSDRKQGAGNRKQEAGNRKQEAGIWDREAAIFANRGRASTNRDTASSLEEKHLRLRQLGKRNRRSTGDALQPTLYNLLSSATALSL
ncbi:unnamed protein product [Pleuronectes platessa]|uniref:Uncharacterized protein n=1 Tax=Pleuronectes platessa TaxID=8262 RepID=A0A9N7YE00_PLEPL|nr:unnamed protein product [Pleuronectes platessa]